MTFDANPCNLRKATLTVLKCCGEIRGCSLHRRCTAGPNSVGVASCASCADRISTVASSVPKPVFSLTIGMPCHTDYAGVWMTIQSLRLHHAADLAGVELLVVDNAPETADGRRTKDFCARAGGAVRYVPYPDRVGSAPAKQRVFDESRGEVVLLLDSHVLLSPGSVGRIREWFAARPETRDMLTCPILTDGLGTLATHLSGDWGGGMKGQWRVNKARLAVGEPFEVEAMGCGFMAMRRSAWPGFDPRQIGFGGEEWIIHDKVRQRGGQVVCLPAATWMHRFNEFAPAAASHRPTLEDKAWNHCVGWLGLGKPLDEVREHYVTIMRPEKFDAIAAAARRGDDLPPHRSGRPTAVDRPGLIVGVCCTYRRPNVLPTLLECFRRQTHPGKRLLVLDDARQYDPTDGDVRIVSTPDRYPSIGAKHAAAVRLALETWPDAAAIAVMDDDDLYLADHFSRIASAVAGGAEWCRQGRFLTTSREPAGGFHEEPDAGQHHGGWAFTPAAYRAAGGYPTDERTDDDHELGRRLFAACGPATLIDGPPSYVYRWGAGAGWHVSSLPGGYAAAADRGDATPVGRIGPRLDAAAVTILGRLGLTETGPLLVQVGANSGKGDPAFDLVSKNGYRALLVEPNPAAMERLRETYRDRLGKVAFAQVAVAGHPGQAVLHVPPNDQHASLDPSHVAAHGHRPESVAEVGVDVVTLRQLLDSHGLASRRIDKLLIDAEGRDAEILLATDFSALDVGSVQFEHAHADGVNRQGETHERLLAHLRNHGYTTIRKVSVLDTVAERPRPASDDPLGDAVAVLSLDATVAEYAVGRAVLTDRLAALHLDRSDRGTVLVMVWGGPPPAKTVRAYRKRVRAMSPCGPRRPPADAADLIALTGHPDAAVLAPDLTAACGLSRRFVAVAGPASGTVPAPPGWAVAGSASGIAVFEREYR